MIDPPFSVIYLTLNLNIKYKLVTNIITKPTTADMYLHILNCVDVNTLKVTIDTIIINTISDKIIGIFLSHI